MNLIDFIIGGLIANSLVHFVLGITKVHFLGLFGYTPNGNIAYGILQFIVALILIFINYNWSEILENGFLIGGLSVLIAYLIFGKFLVSFFARKK